MTTGSLGLRSSGSYGSLQQIQNAAFCLPIQSTPPLSRKPPKMLKEKDRFFHWIFKFAPRKKIGMLLLCFVSLVVFMWVLIVGKGLASYVLTVIAVVFLDLDNLEIIG